MHIDNLYKNQDILMFRDCFALEKVHGSSAHITWKDGAVRYFSGGEAHARFAALFDEVALRKFFLDTFGAAVDVVIYGEVYGGKCQGMSATYGKELRFIAFDVKVDKVWLAVPNAANVAERAGLTFVPFVQGPATVEFCDEQRDAPSGVAARCGMGDDKKREGVVLRPVIELTKNNGERIIAKHKRDEFRETKTPRVVDPGAMVVLRDAEAVAEEWVTEARLANVLSKLEGVVGIERTREVINAMMEDVQRESAGEGEWSQATSRAVGTATAKMFKKRVGVVR
jgi:hypothetical protein